MITERAIVTRCDGPRIELELLRESACGGCELNRGCGTGALARLLGPRRKPISVESDRALRPGDRVTLGLSERALVTASLLIYGLPLAAMLLAGLLIHALLPQLEWAIALASLVGLGFGLHCARRAAAALARDGMTAQIIAVELNPQSLAGS